MGIKSEKFSEMFKCRYLKNLQKYSKGVRVLGYVSPLQKWSNKDGEQKDAQPNSQILGPAV